MGDLVCVRIFFSQTSGHTTVWDFIPAAITRAEIHNSFFSAGYFFSRYFLARYIFSPEICFKSPVPLPTLHPLQNLPNFGTFQMVGPVIPLGTLPKLSLFPVKIKNGWLRLWVQWSYFGWKIRSLLIAQVGYIKIRTYSHGFRDKIAKFSQLHYLAISSRDLSTKKTKPDI